MMCCSHRYLARICLALWLGWALPAQAELVTIATGDYVPWTSSGAKYHGLVNRIIEESFKRRNYEVEFHFMPWARARQDTDEGRFDASSFWFRNADYERDYLLSDTIVVNREVLFHLKRTTLPSWHKLEDLREFKFGATIGYSYTENFWRFGREKILQIEETTSDLVNFRKLVRGRVDIFPCEEVTGWSLLNHEFDSGIASLVTTHQTPLRTTEGTLLFSRGQEKSRRLLADFNAGLMELKADGTLERYYEEMLSGSY